MFFLKSEKTKLFGIFAVVFILIFTTLTNNALSDKEVDQASQLIQKMTQQIEVHLEKTKNAPEDITGAVADIIDEYFDIPNIAKFSAGPYWRGTGADQRERYTRSMRQLMIDTVTRNFDQLAGLKFIQKSSQRKGKRLVVVTGSFNDIEGQKPPVIVGWRVITSSENQSRILDIEIEKISMLVTQKQENMAIIRRNGGQFSALIDSIEKRLEANN